MHETSGNYYWEVIKENGYPYIFFMSLQGKLGKHKANSFLARIKKFCIDRRITTTRVEEFFFLVP